MPEEMFRNGYEPGDIYTRGTYPSVMHQGGVAGDQTGYTLINKAGGPQFSHAVAADGTAAAAFHKVRRRHIRSCRPTPLPCNHSQSPPVLWLHVGRSFGRRLRCRPGDATHPGEVSPLIPLPPPLPPLPVNRVLCHRRTVPRYMYLLSAEPM